MGFVLLAVAVPVLVMLFAVGMERLEAVLLPDDHGAPAEPAPTPGRRPDTAPPPDPVALSTGFAAVEQYLLPAPDGEQPAAP